MASAEELVASERWRSFSDEQKRRLIARNPELAQAIRRRVAQSQPQATPQARQAPQGRPPLGPQTGEAFGDLQGAGRRIARLRPSEFGARAGLITGGAMGGAALGAPAGPLGAAAGGVLGAVGGALGSEVAGLDPSPTVASGLKRAAGEGVVEAATFGAANRIPVVGQAIKRKILGITDDALVRFERARAPVGVADETGELQDIAPGINLPVESVSESRLVTGFRDVIGKFPAPAGILRRGVQRIQREGEKALDAALEAFGPTAHFADIGTDMLKAAQDNVAALRGGIGALYRNFESLAEASGARIPIGSSRESARAILREAFEGGPRGFNPVVLREAREILKLGVDPESGLLQPLTIKQHRGAKNALNRAIEAMEVGAKPDRKAAGQLGQLKKALEIDLNQIEGSDEVLSALREANAAAEDFFKRFEQTPTGARLRAADPGLFTDFSGKTPSLEVDKLFKAAFQSQTGSPQAIDDLARLVNNPRVMRQAGATHINDVLDKAIYTEQNTGNLILRADDLARSLGLFSPKSGQRRALVSIYGEPHVRNLEDVVRALTAVSKTKQVNVSQFIARRAVLGGLGSVQRTFLPGTGKGQTDTIGQVAQAALGLVARIITQRRLASMIVDPQFMRDLAVTIRPNAARDQRIAAALRLTRTTPEVFDVEGTGEGLLPVSQDPGLVGQGARGFARGANVAVPGAAGAGLFLGRSTRPAGRALLGATLGEQLQGLEALALRARDEQRGSRGARARRGTTRR